MTLCEAVEDFLTEQAVRGNSRNTIFNYQVALRFFTDFTGDLPLEEVDLRICRKYYLNLATRGTLSSVSVQTYIRALRAFLNYLYNNEYIAVNICRKFKLPKAQRKCIDVLTDEEVERLFATCAGDTFLDLRNRVILSLMLDSGIRFNELVTAKRCNLHLADRFLIVDGKGNKQRAVVFGLRTQEILAKYLSTAPPHTFVIIKWPGFGPAEAVTVETVKDYFRKLKVRADIPRLHAHLLRHTFATRYLENGGNIYSLQLLLGHTSLEMVKKYLHLATVKVRRDFVNYSPLDRVSESFLAAVSEPAEGNKKPP